MTTTAFILTTLLRASYRRPQEPTTGFAPVNGLKMYYEVHGSGDPVVLLHGSFMTISNNWTKWIGELSKTRKVIALEMQGHGRTADIKRGFTFENLADDSQHNTRHADGAHARHRPDGERFFRCEAATAITEARRMAPSRPSSSGEGCVTIRRQDCATTTSRPSASCPRYPIPASLLRIPTSPSP